MAGGWWLVVGENQELTNDNSDVSAGEAESMKNKIKSYRDLDTWQKAIELVEEVYKETRSFPKEEIYGLLMVRCAKCRLKCLSDTS